MAIRSRASAAPGPAVFRITSSAPQSADPPAQPPSATMTSTGTSRPAVRSSRSSFLTCTRSRRASTSTRSAGGELATAAAVAGAPRTTCGTRLSEGKMSAGGSGALVSRSRLLNRCHLRLAVQPLAEALAIATGQAQERDTEPGKAPDAAPGQARDAGQRMRLSAVLARSSFLVDGVPVGGRGPERVLLSDKAVVEVLPPFAGG